MEKKHIAVIMTVHNRKDKTLKCLASLFANKLSDEIHCYLTDDGCNDGTADAVLERFTNVTVLKGNGSLFWNRGMYKSWNEALSMNPDFYLWLNDDTLLYDNALVTLMNESRQYKGEAIIVGSTCDADRRLSYGGRRKARKHPIVSPKMEKVCDCDTFNGNIVFIPRSVVEKIGILDPYFHHSFGDIEYGLRASSKGIKCIVAPGYLGYCERNNPIPLFRRKQYSVFKRYKLLYSPLGFNPLEDFHLNRKYSPLWKCILWFIKLHINVLFPVDHIKFEK